MRLFEKIYKVISNLITVCLILVVSFFVVTRLIGFVPYTVMSSSMTPIYRVGDIVYTKHADFGNIKKGDVITFNLKGMTNVTHRVVDINTEDKSFVTKGDANDNNDAHFVSYSKVLGVVKFSIPYVGYFTIFCSKFGYVPFITCVISLICIFYFIKKLLEKDNESEEEKMYEKK